MKLSPEAFEAAVERAIARIPDEIRRHLYNLAICVEQRPSRELLAELEVPEGETLFGAFSGVPLQERSPADPPLFPDQIFIFQEPLEQWCLDREELEQEIEITVVHEVAHYMGLDDDQLAELGYD
jgi:predicted Zn-dependent protease with MMP-like domain